MEKKKRKELAEDLHMNVKTMRENRRYAENLEIIAGNLGDDAEKFEEILDKLSRNKKEKLSNSQVAAIARLLPEMQRTICEKIIQHPQNAKTIVNNYLDTNVRTTIEIPASVNDWLSDGAAVYGMSKGKYIAKMLTNLYERENGENGE